MDTDRHNELLSPFTMKAADQMAYEIYLLVKNGTLDSRCPAADALLNYAMTRFCSSDGAQALQKLEAHVTITCGRLKT